jgi:preprotein translocase subunit SecE
MGERGNFLAGVWSELRKTAWPTWPELTKMTAVVIMTVIIFALLIGAADFVLSSLLTHFVYSAK